MKDSEQQYLFEHYNPLEERVGRAFFRELPKESGIYKMYGRGDELLYVGKAKNLRTRLFSYRRARMGQTSRKTVRLIRQIRHIEYELCSGEKEALLRENELIRNRRPAFNRAKKSPEAYYFIHLRREDGEWIFRLDMRRRADESEWTTYGAFKGHRTVRRALGSLLRLLYIRERSLDSVHRLPCVLLRNLTPMNFRLPLSENGSPLAPALLDTLFKGQSLCFFEWAADQFTNRKLLELYIGRLILADMEAVRWFYEKCCRRNFDIVNRLQLDTHIIPKEKLDDYLVELAVHR